MADSNAPKPSSSVKLVLLGEAAVGKSSLVLRFVNNDFQENKEPTIGAAFLTQKCNLPTRTIKFEIWDTAGQERFASLAPMYYRNAQAALVVYDLTKPTSLVKAKHWVVELQRQASPGMVIALVGNKLDLASESAAESEGADTGDDAEDARKVSTEEAKAYADEESLLFFETSAKTGHNVTEVFTAIANSIPETSLKSARGPGAAGSGNRAGEEQRVTLGARDAGVKEGELRSAATAPSDVFSATTKPTLFLPRTRSSASIYLVSAAPSFSDAVDAVAVDCLHEGVVDMAIPISEAQAELISSLSPDDIPIKLRCAICSKLAINAFRLPCCEQAICESCQSDLPPSCPVCEHSPLSAEDCNPNKSLRTTIRVFLRTAEKKREASRPKQPAPATPVAEPKSTPAEPQPASDNDASATTNASGQESADKEGVHTAPVTSVPQDAPASDQTNISHGDEAKTETGPLPSAADPSSHGDEDIVNGESQEVQNSDGQQLGQAGEDVGDENEDENETENEKENYGTDAMNSGYNSAMFSGPGDLNQMQMMMAMQNGMAPGSFGNFSMMGMPGMGMDPMAMQNMYMNGGFQGMGMNGMGGSYGGGFGQGSNMNDWSGSQSWNFDQNNYNQNGTGMGTGDFGNFNSGFHTGYNQGNYGHINDYRRGNFGRGRGRARGAFGSYGRGGYQYHGASNYQGHGHAQAQYMQQQQQHPYQQPQPQPQGVQAYAGQVQDAASTNGNAEDGSDQTANRDSGGQGVGGDLPPAGGVQGQHIEASSSGDAQGNANGTGAIQSVLPAQDVPINAPTGPKAMRQGLPNTSLHNLRARGYPVGNEAQSQINTGTPQPIPRPATVKVGPRSDISLDREQEMQTAHDANREPSKDHEIRDRSNLGSQPPPSRNRSPSRSQMGSVLQSRSGSKNRDRGRDMERSRTRSLSRSRTASRSRKSSHRRRRQRSESVNEDEDDEGPRRKKHHSSSYKKPFYGGDDDQPPENKQADPSRSRSASPQSVKKSTHHHSSHRDKDRTRDSEIRRDRDKDKYRDDEKTKSSRSSHRSSHKDKDRDYDNSSSRRRDKDRDRKDRKERRRDRDRDRDRDRIRDRDRDRDRGSVRDRDRGDKTHTSTSSRRASPSRDRDKPSHGESTDPHTLEREARNRERLLKEAQRMAGLASLAGSKRSRDELGDDAGPTSRRDRRTGRRTEARDGVDEEERMRRLEAEREGGRWG
ncbi:hypothetical protein E4U19_005039 [Claviceps sp. Clav32 group G5]|nr:hypothetical protein E4U19_005039 [Claviceps sp. Clav32 group G5]